MSFTPSRRIGGIKRRLPTTYQGETVLAAISLPPVTAEANRPAPSRPIPAGSRLRRAGRRSQLARTGPPRPGRDRLPARLHRHRRERHPPAPRRGPGTGGPAAGGRIRHSRPLHRRADLHLPRRPPPPGPPSRWSRPHPAARPSVNAGSSARLTPHRAHRSRARRSSSTGPPPGQHAGTRPEHQRPGTRRQSGRGNPRSRPAATYASTTSGRGHTMASGDTASDLFSQSPQHGRSRPRGCAASGGGDRHHAGLLPRADGTLRSSPSSQRSAVQKQQEISKCRRR